MKAAKPTQKRHTPEQKEQIKARRTTGARLHVIAKEFGVSKQRIQQIVGPRTTVPATNAERQAAYRERTKTVPASYGVEDKQSPAELEKRDIEARVAEFRFQTDLANAKADGSRCIQKACPFPAVLNGECRQHAQDRHAPSSLLPSILPLVMDMSIGTAKRARWAPL